MIKTLLHETYHHRLVKTMALSTFPGIIVANFVAPLASVYVLYDYIEESILLSWLVLHLILLASRIVAGKHLIYLVDIKSSNVEYYLKIVSFLSMCTTLLFGYLIWTSILVDADDLHIFVLAIIIIALSTGSISTLGSVFSLFFMFVVSNALFLVSASLYHGGDMFGMLALSMTILSVIMITGGYKHYTVLRNSVALDETFRTIYYNSSDGVIITEHGRFVRCNHAILTMFKIPSEEIFFKTHIGRFSPKNQPDGRDSMRKMVYMYEVANRYGSNSFEWLHKDYEGKEFWCEIVLTKIHLKGKYLLHGVWRDISARKDMELANIEHKKEIELLNESLESRVKEEVEKNMQKDRQMLHQSRLAQMGEMLSMIAHQWRQPLSAISSAATAIGLKAKLNKLDNASATELSSNIASYVQHLSETINDFRDFFKQNREKVLTNYNDVIKSVIRITRSSLENKKINIIQELTCDASFTSYNNELKQVVLNLIKNAEDALVERSTQNPYVKIRTYEKDKKAILEIVDNAGGIKEEIREKIFNPYFSTKTKKDGTGLGLYMSKIIIEEHCNGKLIQENTEDGALFRIEIELA